jgi:Ankyrin repeats (3 copies)
MKNSDITDPRFLEAVEAIDIGNIPALERLISEHPRLVRERLKTPENGYFKDPYLLWFVADNPIRIQKLPPNIIDVTRLLVKAVQREAADSLQQQLDYTLGLVGTGRIPRESGMQIGLMDLLIDSGAKPGKGLGAFAHGNIEAGGHLIERGGELTLAAAVCLDRMSDVENLAPKASMEEKQVALTAAAFYGKTPMINYLLALGIDPNIYPEQSTGFHTHATPLHQAVYSGSLESVQLLVEAGANLDWKDHVYGGTPLDWAAYMQSGEEMIDEEAKKRFAAIETYLRERLVRPV